MVSTDAAVDDLTSLDPEEGQEFRTNQGHYKTQADMDAERMRRIDMR